MEEKLVNLKFVVLSDKTEAELKVIVSELLNEGVTAKSLDLKRVVVLQVS